MIAILLPHKLVSAAFATASAGVAGPLSRANAGSVEPSPSHLRQAAPGLIRSTGQLSPSELPPHWLDELLAQAARTLPPPNSGTPAVPAVPGSVEPGSAPHRSFPLHFCHFRSNRTALAIAADAAARRRDAYCTPLSGHVLCRALVATPFPIQRPVSAHRQPLFSSMGLVKTGDHYDELHPELLEGRRRRYGH